MPDFRMNRRTRKAFPLPGRMVTGEIGDRVEGSIEIVPPETDKLATAGTLEGVRCGDCDSIYLINPVPTRVIFRRYPEDGTIIALFPDDNYESGVTNYGRIMSYVHFGQHGEADPNIVLHDTVPATPEQYSELKQELEQLYGYRLVPKKKIMHPGRRGLPVGSSQRWEAEHHA